MSPLLIICPTSILQGVFTLQGEGTLALKGKNELCFHMEAENPANEGFAQRKSHPRTQHTF